MADDLIPATKGEPVGPDELNETDLALLGAHAADIGQAYAGQIAGAFDGEVARAVGQYFESLFSGRYDAADREVANVPVAAYGKMHEVAVAAIIKAHRRNETKLYQTLVAYLRVTQADLALIARPAIQALPRATKSA
jgi:hypothetical protein